jgi:hypothetical protein
MIVVFISVVQLGLRLVIIFRIEFDARHQKNDINLDTTLVWTDTFGTIGMSGDIEQIPLTLNMIWEGDGEVKPYLGASVDTTRSKTSANLTDDGVFRTS